MADLVNQKIAEKKILLPVGAAVGEQQAAPAPPKQAQSIGSKIADVAFGPAETALSVGSSMIGGPAGAAYGFLKQAAHELRTGQYGTSDAADRIEQMANHYAENLTYTPRTEFGKKAVGAIGEASQQLTPIAPLAELQPLAESAGYLKGKYAPEVTPKAAPKPPPQATPKQIEDIYTGMVKKKPGVAAQSKPDPAILKAADELGIDLPPGAESTSPTYKEAVQAMKSQPGSNIKALEERSLQQLSNTADNLIRKYGGSTDKTSFSVATRNKTLDTIDTLKSRSSAINENIDNAINPAAPIQANNTRAYIQDTVSQLGGNTSLLNGAEKQLHGLFTGDQPPTYAALNRVRQDIGAAIGKQSSPYGDVNTGKLKQMDRALSQDRQEFIRGVDPQLEGGLTKANWMDVRRKALENQATRIYGKDLQTTGTTAMKTAVNQLVNNGDIGNFERFMQSLPKTKRRDMAATALNDIFTSGARKGGALGGGFVTAGEQLNRNVAAKDAFFKYLPPKARADFDKLHTVAKGIYDSINRENKSKTARDVLYGLESGGLYKKMVGGGEWILSKFVGRSIAEKAADIARGKKRSQMAEDFITSPKFREALVKAAEDKAAAERIVKSSTKYKAFISTLTPKEQAEIARVGFVTWVTQTNQKHE